MKDYIAVNRKNARRIVAKNNKDRFNRLKDNRYIPAINMFSEYVNKSVSILDIGTREGYFLDVLKENGFENIYAIDVFEEGIRQVKKRGYEAEVADAQCFNLNKKFDLIITMHSLEHCPEPAKVVNCIYDHLYDGGILYVEVPTQVKESVPTPHAHFYCFVDLEELLSFFDNTKWESLKTEYKERKKRKGIIKCVFKKRG